MSYKTKHPLKTEAVAAFVGVGAVLAGVSTWLTDSLEPWAQGVIAGAVALLVGLVARFKVWSERSVSELQGDDVVDDVIYERVAKDLDSQITITRDVRGPEDFADLPPV